MNMSSRERIILMENTSEIIKNEQGQGSGGGHGLPDGIGIDEVSKKIKQQIKEDEENQ